LLVSRALHHLGTSLGVRLLVSRALHHLGTSLGVRLRISPQPEPSRHLVSCARLRISPGLNHLGT
ncbi:MAG: hypothetical protein DIU78_021975, partial [Pseudomonadota bacterium]